MDFVYHQLKLDATHEITISHHNPRDQGPVIALKIELHWLYLFNSNSDLPPTLRSLTIRLTKSYISATLYGLTLYLSAMSESPSTDPPELWNAAIVQRLKERYECPNFRILVVGRANAGKTTILEKVCGIQQGTKPIIRKAPGPSLVAPGPSLVAPGPSLAAQAPQTPSLFRRVFNRPKRSAEFLKPSIYVSDV